MLTIAVYPTIYLYRENIWMSSFSNTIDTIGNMKTL